MWAGDGYTLPGPEGTTKFANPLPQYGVKADQSVLLVKVLSYSRRPLPQNALWRIWFLGKDLSLEESAPSPDLFVLFVNQ